MSSFTQQGEWVCGFLESNPGTFGFAPTACLRFERETRSGPPSRVTTPKPRDDPTRPDASHIRAFLDDVYSSVAEKVAGESEN